jgi:hypothetical protein
MSGLTMLIILVTGAVGTGMAIYGLRQKEPAPLVFGVVISIVPWMVPDWVAAIVSVGLIALFMAVRKRL